MSEHSERSVDGRSEDYARSHSERSVDERSEDYA